MAISNQISAVSTGTTPYANQQNFGQLIGEVNAWNTGISPDLVGNFINNAVREYYDRRLWYGLMAKGQFNSPGYYSTGTVTLTNGSASVQGNNTAWTSTLNGVGITSQQLRVGFIAPVMNIVALDQVNQVLTLEMPWGLPTMTATGYFITQYYFSVPNIKYIYSCKNLQMMYRMWTNVPQALLENWDPSRLQLMYPRVLATMPPDVNGNYQVEMWPAPNTQQSFPYLGYVQPPNLADDTDNLPPYIRADVVKARATYEVLLYHPRTNPNYSETVCVTIAQQKLRQFEEGIASASQADEQLYRQDIVLWQEQMPMAAMDFGTGMLMGGSFLAAMTPVMSDY